MPNFSTKSTERLMSCHPDLQRLFKEVVKHWDCKVLEGYRDKETQNRYFAEGKTKLKFPAGKHNITPARAIDIVPYPINFEFEGELKKAAKEGDWNKYNSCLHNIEEWSMFIGFVKGVAKMMNIDIRVGADWDGDNKMADQKFDDFPHIELA